MPNYQKMYAIVCAAASDAVDCIREGKTVHAEHMLLLALRRAEEIYLGEDEAQFAARMAEFAAYRGEKFEREAQRLNADPTAAVPEEVHRRMIDTIQNALKDRQGE